MKKRISFKLFFTVLWRGVCQAFQSVGRLFGYKAQSMYSKIVWNLFAGCITALVVLFTGCVFYTFTTEIVYKKWIQPKMDSFTWAEKHIGNHIVLQSSWRVDYFRVYDKNHKRVVLDDVDWVITSDDKDSLAVFARNGKRGYINRMTGIVAIPESYTRAWVFSEGLAAVEKDGELVFIDHSGKVVIDKDFQVQYDDPKYAFKNGYCMIKDPVTGRMGLIDKEGEWVLNPVFDNLFNNEGFWQVEKDCCVGLYTSDLEEMFPTTNTGIVIADGVIEVRHADHTAKLYDYDGNILVDFMIDNICNMQYVTGELRNDLPTLDSDGDATDKNVYAIANRLRYQVDSGILSCQEYYGLMSREGKRITPPIYTSIEAIGADRYLSQPQGIIIDDDGNVIE